MTETEQLYYRPGDKPIKEKDELHVSERIVNTISSFLEDSQGTALTVAITGEWGIGKTSVMNLLAKDLSKNKNSIIIRFEPLLEGKLEVLEIMELFYQKLYTGLTAIGKNKSMRVIFKALLTNIASGTTIKLSTGPVSADIDCEKIVDNWLDTCETSKSPLLSKKTEELNAQITKEKLNIFVFIDELDRLSAKHIIHFLMFARILEDFDNLICIVGIDYTSVIQSLRSDSNSGMNTYETAKNYLDKLFQARFDVSHNLEALTSFAFNQLRRIDSLNFEDVLDTRDHITHNKLNEIIEYLKTPRKIKKWAIMIFIHKILIKFYPNDIMHFLMLCAICVKHPIILDDLANKTLPLLNNRPHDGAPEKQIEFQGRLLETVRITNERNNETCIFDSVAYGFLKEILSEKPVKASWLSLLVRGYENETQVMVYSHYFGKKINNALDSLVDANNSSTLLILSDLKYALLKQQNYPSAVADITLINQLGEILIDPYSLFTKYPEVLIAPVSKLDITHMTENAHVDLLVLYINSILCFQSNKDSLAASSFDSSVLSEIKYSKKVLSFLLQQAILRIERDLSSVDKIEAILERRINLVAVLYSFIEWCKKKRMKNKVEFLSDKIRLYFINDTVSKKNKIFLYDLLCEENKLLDKLFNCNFELLLQFRSFSEEKYKELVAEIAELSLMEAECL